MTQLSKVVWLSLLISMCGCSSILHKNNGVFGKDSKAEDKALAQITSVDRKTARVNEQRLDEIGKLSFGVGYGLDTTNTFAAKELNLRVESLANKPSLDAVKEIKALVNVTTNNTKQLEAKDSEISTLLNSVEQLKQDKQSAVDNYIKVADKAASEADQYKATLKNMDSFFGLGAVFYGVKKLVVSAAWFIGIGSVLFLILRFAATTNPLAGTIFAVFENLMAYVVKAIMAVFPKVLNYVDKGIQTIETKL